MFSLNIYRTVFLIIAIFSISGCVVKGNNLIGSIDENIDNPLVGIWACKDEPDTGIVYFIIQKTKITGQYSIKMRIKIRSKNSRNIYEMLTHKEIDTPIFAYATVYHGRNYLNSVHKLKPKPKLQQIKSMSKQQIKYFKNYKRFVYFKYSIYFNNLMILPPNADIVLKDVEQKVIGGTGRRGRFTAWLDLKENALLLSNYFSKNDKRIFSTKAINSKFEKVANLNSQTNLGCSSYFLLNSFIMETKGEHVGSPKSSKIPKNSLKLFKYQYK